MKRHNNLKINRFCLIATITILIIGCKKSDNITLRTLDNAVDSKLIEEIEYSGVGVPFPDGSIATCISDGFFELTLPKDYFYVIKTDDNSKGWVTSPVIGITCTCNCGHGYTPVMFNSTFVCIMEETCTCCESQPKYKDERKKWTDVEIVGLINKNAGITLLTENNIPDNKTLISHGIKHKSIIHGNAFEELFEMDLVKDYLTETADFFSSNNITPNVYAFFNILGNVALVPFNLPEESIISYSDESGLHDIFAMSIPLKSAPEDVIHCECKSGSDGCTAAKQWTPLGTIYYCNTGNCTSCSLQELR